MVVYSQKWHNETSRGRSIETSDRLAAIQAELNNLGREIKKLNEKVYAAQVGWEYRATTPGYYQRNNANPSYQKRRQFMEDTLSKFMSESAKRHEENPNLIKEIRATTDAAIRNQRASIKTLDIQIWQMSKNSKLMYKSRQTTIPFPSRLDNHYCEEEEGGIYGPKFMEASGASHINHTIPQKEKDLGSFTLPCFINNVCFDNTLVDLRANVSVMPLLTYLNLGLDFIILDMPEDIKVPLILGRPFLSTARSKIDVYKRKITLRVGEGKIIFKSVKPASSLIRRVYMLGLRERMELDLEARLMGETLVLNRSLDPFLEDYIELNDLNEPVELRRNQGDDLMPTINEGEVIEEFRTRDEDLDTTRELEDYPILENMDAYRDEGMGDVIVGKPSLREFGIKAKRFEGTITFYKGDDEVTYQMVRSHPRFKHHTNEQCNKIPPLLKDLKKEISTNIGGESKFLEILKCWILKLQGGCST
ncbi:hypothetical protein Tco_1042835 [Tanacetum coccineum]|uniref:Reverse transcriptase domain-containing protein n=1 Tax=Tanacetum coccineum TaxID=301880 RepID=A0ABQ5GLK0_9ASTR